jgi:6-phosphogluconolactonase/glucosamine-6-phosphate isomerase/deaminase
VLATGLAKANTVRCGLGDTQDPQCPVSLLSTTRGHLVWWLDRAAAAKVSIKD